MPSLMNENNIQSLAITRDLYRKILSYVGKNGLITSTYNHGHGVDRKYTIYFFLQKTHKSEKPKYYLKRGGGHPSRSEIRFGGGKNFSSEREYIETLKSDTLDFDSLCRIIAKKNASQVLFVNRYANGRLKDGPPPLDLSDDLLSFDLYDGSIPIDLGDDPLPLDLD